MLDLGFTHALGGGLRLLRWRRSGFRWRSHIAARGRTGDKEPGTIRTPRPTRAGRSLAGSRRSRRTVGSATRVAGCRAGPSLWCRRTRSGRARGGACRGLWFRRAGSDRGAAISGLLSLQIKNPFLVFLSSCQAASTLRRAGLGGGRGGIARSGGALEGRSFRRSRRRGAGSWRCSRGRFDGRGCCRTQNDSRLLARSPSCGFEHHGRFWGRSGSGRGRGLLAISGGSGGRGGRQRRGGGRCGSRRRTRGSGTFARSRCSLSLKQRDLLLRETVGVMGEPHPQTLSRCQDLARRHSQLFRQLVYTQEESLLTSGRQAASWPS